MSSTDSSCVDEVRAEIIEYVLRNYVTEFDARTLPLDKSLVELGILDSFGVVELVAYLEDRWSISIKDEEITREKMGSIDKMVFLVFGKLNP